MSGPTCDGVAGEGGPSVGLGCQAAAWLEGLLRSHAEAPCGLPLHEVFDLESAASPSGSIALAMEEAFGAVPLRALQEHLHAIACDALEADPTLA